MSSLYERDIPRQLCSGIARQKNQSQKLLFGQQKLTLWLDLLSAVFTCVLVQNGSLLAVAAHFMRMDTHSQQTQYPAGLLFGALFMLCAYQLGLYRARPESLWKQQIKLVQACIIAAVLLVGSITLLHGTIAPASLSLLLVGTFSLVSVRRQLYRAVSAKTTIHTRTVVVLGDEFCFPHLQNDMEAFRGSGLEFAGFFSCPEPFTDNRSPSDQAESCICFARKQFADVLLVSSRVEPALLQALLKKAETVQIDVQLFVQEVLEHDLSLSPEYVGNLVCLPLVRRGFPASALRIKRTLDLILATLGLILLSPLLLAICLAVRLDSEGPLFYRAKRIGHKGKQFSCYKFRSMVSDADQRKAALEHRNERHGILFKMKDDPRVTRIGRLLRQYSLDELPQLYNVLRGEMSLVGPRPPTGPEVEQYELHHLRRLSVMPGITGLWQVEARHDPSFESYISLDLAYLDSWSIWKDLAILARTVGAVLGGTGS